jgi:hypothetical protein
MYLSEKFLTGTILPSFARFSGVESFRIGQNLPNWTIPALLGTMVNMPYLGLYENDFTGTLPDLSGLTLLVGLNVVANPLPGVPGANDEAEEARVDLRSSCT